MEKTKLSGNITENKRFSEHSAKQNAPVTKFKAGAVSATIWENQNKNDKGEEVSYMTISLERNYKDKNDQWQKTNSFRTNDLPKASLVLTKAFEFLALSAEA